MRGQSGYKAPRSGGPMMKGIPQPQGGFTGPAGMGPQRMPQAPRGMAIRTPLIANKERGTISSAIYSQIPASMSGMGQSGTMAQGSQAGMGIPQPQGSFTGPAGMGPQRMPQAPMGMATRPPLIANKARGTMSSANRAAMGMF